MIAIHLWLLVTMVNSMKLEYMLLIVLGSCAHSARPNHSLYLFHKLTYIHLMSHSLGYL